MEAVSNDEERAKAVKELEYFTVSVDFSCLLFILAMAKCGVDLPKSQRFLER